MPFNREIYGPDVLNLMSRALRAASDELPSLDYVAEDEARRMSMATRIMAAVATGERDFEALKRAALAKT